MRTDSSGRRSELSENGSVFWTSLLNQRYNVTFFRPRLFTEVAPNVYVTSNSMGFAVFLALANELHILPFFVPLTALLGVLGAYGAVAEVSGKKAGVLVAATLATLPPYVFFSNTYMDIVPSLSFFLLSLFGFLKYMKSSKTWQVVISSLCLAIAIYLRTYSALFLVGYAAIVLLARKRLHVKSFAIGVASFLLFVTPVFLTNSLVYGGPFRFGPSFTQQKTFELAAGQSITVQVFQVAFVNHVALTAPVLFAMGILGLVEIFRRKRTQMENTFLAQLGTISVVAFVAFGPLSRTYGFYDVTPVASVTRYLMPVQLLIAFCAYIFVKRLRDIGMKRLSMVLVAVLLVSLVAGSFASNALPSLVTSQQKYSNGEEVIQALPENSVIFTRTFDKLIFPSRNVAIIYTNSDLTQNPDLKFIVPIVDIDRDVVPVIRKLLHDGFHVYLAEDVDDLAAHLIRAGFAVVRVDATFGIREVLP